MGCRWWRLRWPSGVFKHFFPRMSLLDVRPPYIGGVTAGAGLLDGRGNSLLRPTFHGAPGFRLRGISTKYPDCVGRDRGDPIPLQRGKNTKEAACRSGA
jgi:hypothetical protein